tara:strand:+ start:951 stop:1253 length:303 start_codon:yes stop_codon:yes gene_type:complete
MKRYSISTKTKALNLLKTLELEQGQTVSKDIHGIMVWGFEDKQVPILDEDGMQTFDADGLPLVDIIKGTTYNIDVVWKGEQPSEWEQYEVNPSSPSHTVS